MTVYKSRSPFSTNLYKIENAKKIVMIAVASRQSVRVLDNLF